MATPDRRTFDLPTTDRPPTAPSDPARGRGPRASTARRRALAAAGTLLIALVGAAAGCSRDASTDVVDLATAREEHEAGRALLVDLREPAEHATGVVAGARLLPTRQLRDRIAEIPTDPARPVLLICNTQNRSKAALKALRDAGDYRHVRYVEGGMSEWARRGWPMVAPTR